MNFRLIAFLATVFVGLTIVNHIMGGAFVSTQDIDILNKTNVVSTYNLGILSIPIPNTTYLSGILHMIKWDYSFFGGNAGLILFFLYSITFAVMVVLIFSVLSLIGYQVSRR